MPKTNIDFWKAKFEANVARDQRKTEELVSSGWKVMVVWECELGRKDSNRIDEIEKMLKETK